MEADDAIRLVEAVQRGDLTADEFAILVNKENKGSVPPRNSGPGADQIVTFVAIVGALLMAAGTALPWATFFAVSINGFNGHLPIQTVLIVLSGAGSLVFLIEASWSRFLALILSSVGLSIGGYYFIRLLIGEKGEFFGEQIRLSISPGIGLWAIVIGGLACVGVHAWVLLKRPKAPLTLKVPQPYKVSRLPEASEPVTASRPLININPRSAWGEASEPATASRPLKSPQTGSSGLINGYKIKRGAKLENAELRGADLKGADLRNANLVGANLSHANLRGGNLMETNLEFANLVKANLTGANLCYAILCHVDLSGADLTRADLTGADLAGVIWSVNTLWPAGFTPPTSAQ
ncbi:unannotated protein [freshwater metagenome]|uniref:Unannotated protein n=1 Tax=freshwater metagenome TaxID=449393 RepID=A0A6J7JFP8_9ZZZZ|nr:hypothetical protein [Actinomycetota bacterium]